MSAGHVDLQQWGGGCWVDGFAQFCNPFGGLHIEHACIVQTGHRRDSGVAHGADVLVGGVGLHVLVHFLILNGVAPFFPFQSRKRQVRVKDGGERIHEGNLGY